MQIAAVAVLVISPTRREVKPVQLVLQVNTPIKREVKTAGRVRQVSVNVSSV